MRMNRRGFFATISGALLAKPTLSLVGDPEIEPAPITWEVLEIIHRPVQVGTGWFDEFVRAVDMRALRNSVRLTEIWQREHCPFIYLKPHKVPWEKELEISKISEPIRIDPDHPPLGLVLESEMTRDQFKRRYPDWRTPCES